MSVKLAVAGWAFFLAENVILSENRTKIIELLNDDKEESRYHMVYGTCSTVATGAILYSFVKARKVRQRGGARFRLRQMSSLVQR